MRPTPRPRLPSRPSKRRVPVPAMRLHASRRRSPTAPRKTTPGPKPPRVQLPVHLLRLPRRPAMRCRPCARARPCRRSPRGGAFQRAFAGPDHAGVAAHQPGRLHQRQHQPPGSRAQCCARRRKMRLPRSVRPKRRSWCVSRPPSGGRRDRRCRNRPRPALPLPLPQRRRPPRLPQRPATARGSKSPLQWRVRPTRPALRPAPVPKARARWRPINSCSRPRKTSPPAMRSCRTCGAAWRIWKSSSSNSKR